VNHSTSQHRSPRLTPASRRDFLKLAGLAGGVVGATGVLAACGGGAGGSAGAKTIGISLNGNNAYSSYVAEGALKVFKEAGYGFKGVQNNFDSSVELGNIQSLLNQGINGLVVLPADAATLAKAAQLATQQNIPVGNTLWPGPSGADKNFAGVANLDSTEGGRMIGRWLRQNAKPGKIIVVQGIVGQGFSEKLDAGLDEVLAGSGFTVAVREQGFFARDKATTIVETGLQAHPDTTAIVSYSASMSNGIASYLKSRNISTVAHTGSDCDDEMVTWLKTPYLTAARYYSAGQTGVVAATAVVDKLQGKTVTFDNPIYQSMVTAETIGSAVAEHPYRYPEFASTASQI
jgi:ABC-type sugar transport system substrate-binding protein